MATIPPAHPLRDIKDFGGFHATRSDTFGRPRQSGLSGRAILVKTKKSQEAIVTR